MGVYFLDSLMTYFRGNRRGNQHSQAEREFVTPEHVGAAKIDAESAASLAGRTWWQSAFSRVMRNMGGMSKGGDDYWFGICQWL